MSSSIVRSSDFQATELIANAEKLLCPGNRISPSGFWFLSLITYRLTNPSFSDFTNNKVAMSNGFWHVFAHVHLQ
ncbi:hypothetical protein TIFTF001_012460 [Ficus carica]|uniref:Uncharacterized protein n=1 Tax=Ficus carica TaxID=3494 RepID=A0AA88AFZ7_FICCA|nr:hypothetical protein TIFTF001_012460 [Ficus carica]